MKNINVLPTDKPSRLRVHECGQLFLSINFIYEINDENKKHIYITSDEEIKDGDFAYDSTSKTIAKVDFIKDRGDGILIVGAHSINLDDNYTDLLSNFKKIILTTDQDLIKDGVQVIDDDFLEWFVKNPSCEMVEVKKESQFYRSGPLDKLGYSVVSYKIIIPEKITRCCGRCNGVDDLCYTDMCCDDHHEYGCEICYGKRVEYKIDIPREDWLLNNPQCKQIESCSKSLSKKCICTKEEPKQETLEEAKKYLSNKGYGKGSNFTLNNVANLMLEWQQEQDKNKYSEEDVRGMLEDMSRYVSTKEMRDDVVAVGYSEWVRKRDWFVNHLIEQFKNK
jgi:hypothetical protein